MSAPENPFAFPLAMTAESVDIPGMTLRDWFAGQLAAAEVALAGANHKAAMALVDAAERACRDIPQQIAFNAYAVADAMLAERAKGGAA